MSPEWSSGRGYQLAYEAPPSGALSAGPSLRSISTCTASPRSATARRSSSVSIRRVARAGAIAARGIAGSVLRGIAALFVALGVRGFAPPPDWDA